MELRTFVPDFKGIHAKHKAEIYEKLKTNKLFQYFLNFCENVRIPTKDYGIIHFSPNRWTLLQWKIAEAFFDPDIETIMILKARQLGSTTICCLLNLFYAFTIPQLKGIVVGSDYEQVLMPIQKMREAYSGIPRKLKMPLDANSYKMMKFRNGNYFVFFYPARKGDKQGTMGRGGSFNYAHFTEVAFMANTWDVEVIEASLSTHYPYRKFIYETTANGYNWWYERWEATKKSPRIAHIFCGWWAREDYILTHPDELRYYLKKEVFPWEEEKIKEVKEKYGVTITEPQIAWWRKQAIEKYAKNENVLLAEFPFTEEDAFACSTETFISKSEYDFLNETRMPPKVCYNISWGRDWYETQLEPSSTGWLKIWKHWSERNPYAKYIIGVDPSFSTARSSSNSAFQVLECYKDRIEQVAEFASNVIDLNRFCLLVYYIATKYDAVINYEIQGGGQAFIPFLNNLPHVLRGLNTENPLIEELRSAVLKEYLYRRADTLKGKSSNKGVAMTPSLKQRAFLSLQAYINNKMILLRSGALIEEIRNLVLIDDEFIQKSAKIKTDRLMALLIALIAYQDLVPGMVQSKRTFPPPQSDLLTYDEATELWKREQYNKEEVMRQRMLSSFNQYLLARIFRGRMS